MAWKPEIRCGCSLPGQTIQGTLHTCHQSMQSRNTRPVSSPFSTCNVYCTRSLSWLASRNNDHRSFLFHLTGCASNIHFDGLQAEKQRSQIPSFSSCRVHFRNPLSWHASKKVIITDHSLSILKSALPTLAFPGLQAGKSLWVPPKVSNICRRSAS